MPELLERSFPGPHVILGKEIVCSRQISSTTSAYNKILFNTDIEGTELNVRIIYGGVRIVEAEFV